MIAAQLIIVAIAFGPFGQRGDERLGFVQGSQLQRQAAATKGVARAGVEMRKTFRILQKSLELIAGHVDNAGYSRAGDVSLVRALGEPRIQSYLGARR
ncbi:MAG TPA: hypothetical protein VN699_14590 [Pirellulales bacterium]|nr:hypothetical protein [Pirellulales bacterium]